VVDAPDGRRKERQPRLAELFEPLVVPLVPLLFCFSEINEPNRNQRFFGDP